MISGEDIEAFRPDLETADRIVARAERGVSRFRMIRAEEEMPLIRAYYVMRDLAAQGAAFMAAAQQASIDSMGCFDRDGKRSD